MQEKWDEANFKTWFKDNWFMNKTEDKYIVAVPNAFVCDMLQFRLYDD
jgi:chromosomal replication initiation ATPase DnaA